MIAKIQIKVGIRKYSNLKVVFWLFFHNSSTTKGHHRYDGIRTYTSPRDAEGITGHITATFHIFPYLLALKITFSLNIDHAGQKKEKIFSRIRKWCG
ncbi:MAG: hypothetical protein J6A02_07020 [Prevotella sp.]|nr:hypothetical protein [Prevotella sp.]